MNDKNKTVVIHLDALLSSDSNENNVVPKVKSGTCDFLKNIYEFYPKLHIHSNINTMVVRKLLRDINVDELINSVDIVEPECCIYIGKNSIKFNDTTNDALKFVPILNYTINFLNKVV